MRAGTAAAVALGPEQGAARISAGNYGGKLGPASFPFVGSAAMTALRFVLRFPPPMRLDLSPLIPERLARMEASAIERIELGSARASVRVGDVFRLQTGEAPRVTIEGGSERFDFLGAEMSSGEVLLDGEAGYAAGRRMAGGRLEIRGDAGGWAGSGTARRDGGDSGRCGRDAGGTVRRGTRRNGRRHADRAGRAQASGRATGCDAA